MPARDFNEGFGNDLTILLSFCFEYLEKTFLVSDLNESVSLCFDPTGSCFPIPPEAQFSAGIEVGWYNSKVMRYVQPSSKQPKILEAFKLSLDTLSKRVYLLLIPIAFDLFFLFGRRILVSNLLKSWLDALVLPANLSADLTTSWDQISQQFLKMMANFSLTGFLRSFPIGVPSLLAFRPLSSNPAGDFKTVQAAGTGQVFLAILGFFVIGFLLGAVFFLLIGYFQKNRQTGSSLKTIAQNLLSLFYIPLLSGAAFLVFFIPALMIISFFSSFLPFLGSIGYFILSVFIISRLTPLIFAPHDIVLFNSSFPEALRQSLKIVRPTNTKTSVFLLLAFLASYGTNYLWQIPRDDSWMLLVSIFGHAIVSTLLIIASFHFYIDARACVLESAALEAEQSKQMV